VGLSIFAMETFGYVTVVRTVEASTTSVGLSVYSTEIFGNVIAIGTVEPSTACMGLAQARPNNTCCTSEM